MREKFWELPLRELMQDEWEALCDRCGKCCLIKLEDEDTGEIAFTTLACKLFDSEKCQCSNYAYRHDHVSDCLTLNMDSIAGAEYWLPRSCAYVLRYHDQPLPQWHHLRTGSFVAMHRAGKSVISRTTSEEIMVDLEDAVAYIDQDLGP